MNAARERTYRWSDPRDVAERVLGRDHMQWMQAMRDGDVPAAPFAQTLELRPESVEDGRVVFRMPLREWMCNPAGVIHGGLSATILDTVLTLAAMTKLPSDKTCTTIDLNVHFVRPLFPTGEDIVAEGLAVHIGATICTAEGRLHDKRGRLIAHATAALGVIQASALANGAASGRGE